MLKNLERLEKYLFYSIGKKYSYIAKLLNNFSCHNFSVDLVFFLASFLLWTQWWNLNWTHFSSQKHQCWFCHCSNGYNQSRTEKSDGEGYEICFQRNSSWSECWVRGSPKTIKLVLKKYWLFLNVCFLSFRIFSDEFFQEVYQKFLEEVKNENIWRRKLNH